MLASKDVFRGNDSFLSWMLTPPGFYYVKKPKRFVILSSDKSSERNLSCFFDIIEPRRIENLQSEEPFSSDPYFNRDVLLLTTLRYLLFKVFKYILLSYMYLFTVHKGSQQFFKFLSNVLTIFSALVTVFFLSLRKITWFNSEQPKTWTNVDHLSLPTELYCSNFRTGWFCFKYLN